MNKQLDRKWRFPGVIRERVFARACGAFVRHDRASERAKVLKRDRGMMMARTSKYPGPL